jgi:hypothetical protein
VVASGLAGADKIDVKTRKVADTHKVGERSSPDTR